MAARLRAIATRKLNANSALHMAMSPVGADVMGFLFCDFLATLGRKAGHLAFVPCLINDYVHVIA